MEKTLLTEESRPRSRVGPLVYASGCLAGAVLMAFCGVFATSFIRPQAFALGARAEAQCGGSGASSVNEAFGQFSQLVFAARNVSSPGYQANIEAIASCFSTNSLVRFYNQHTDKMRVFSGEEDMHRFLEWVMQLTCAQTPDISAVHSVDEKGGTVFIAWRYRQGGCGASTETYVYDADLKIHRLNAFVDWPLLPPSA